MKRSRDEMSGRSASEAVELWDSQPADEGWPVGNAVSIGSREVYIIEDEGDNEYEIERMVSRVLDIFPDADVQSIVNLLQSCTYDEAVAKMAFEGYTKASKYPSGSSSSSSSIDIGSIDFSSPNDKWVTTEYIMGAHGALECAFPFLKLVDIKCLLSRNSNVYWKCFEEVMNLLRMVLPVDPFAEAAPAVAEVYGRWRDSKPLLTEVLQQHGLHLKQTRPSGERRSQGSAAHPVLQAEIQWYNQNLREKKLERDRQRTIETNNERAELEGTLVECGCCFGDFAFENLVQCSEGHLFCQDCLTRHTEQTLYGNGKTILACMNTVGERCVGFFSDNTLRLALPPKVYQKFNEAQSRDVIKAAQLENVIACFNCAMLTELPLDAGKVLICPNCHKATCRECGDEAHIPLKCEEVEKKAQTNLRVRVEEALTKAKVRECPKCHQKFYKSDGCNKMTCPCGINICYICRENITKAKYAHFCQQAHCNHKACGRCTLYSDSNADDLLAMRDAGLKEINNVKNDSTATISSSEEGNESKRDHDVDVHIDLDKYLEASASGSVPNVELRHVPVPGRIDPARMRRGPGGGIIQTRRR